MVLMGSLYPSLVFIIKVFTMVQSIKDEQLLDWWQNAVFYQIYPRSFKDSDNDGVGDLKGITEKLGYLKKTGVNALWLTPIFETPMMNYGYDISNYTAIYHLFGNLSDLIELKDKAHTLGIRVILDLVVNHVSTECDWFKKSVQKIEPYTYYFVWENGKIDKDGREIPPSNWLSVYGHSAWRWSEERKQYYLHQFSMHEADLNYRNPLVIEEIKNIMKYWLDKGFDGFRIYAPYFLVEDIDILDEPVSSDLKSYPGEYEYLNHIYTVNQPQSISVVQEWRQLLDSYKDKDGKTRILMTEPYGNLEDQFLYVGTKDKPGVHMILNYALIEDMNFNSSAEEFKTAIETTLNNSITYGTWNNWQLNAHRSQRIASRFGDDLVDGMHMLIHWLPGTSFTYYGDEIGMNDTLLYQTYHYKRHTQYDLSNRESFSTPFQWNDTANAGFSAGNRTWLPINTNYKTVNLQKQRNSLLSHYMIYKILVAARKSPTLQRGSVNVQVLSEKVLAFVRKLDDEPPYVVVINLGSEIETVNLTAFYEIPDTAMVIAASVNSGLTLGAPQSTSFMVLFPKMSIALVAADANEISAANCITMSFLFFTFTVLLNLNVYMS